jgi:hypothetical protein
MAALMCRLRHRAVLSLDDDLLLRCADFERAFARFDALLMSCPGVSQSSWCMTFGFHVSCSVTLRRQSIVSLDCCRTIRMLAH